MASNDEMSNRLVRRSYSASPYLRRLETKGLISTPFAQRTRPMQMQPVMIRLVQEVEGDRISESGEKCCTHDDACACPTCLGLQCLERPKYFSGQMLNEADLTSEQDYLRAKNRLHNRYLHGWGVVCGLEVECSDCDGEVVIKPGYALDPCGEDILVCQETSFNVIEAVEKSLVQGRQPCDPYRPPKKHACPDQVEHWSITLSYKEMDGRQIKTTRRSCSTDGQPGAACLPTRTYEGYTIGLVPAQEGCCNEYEPTCAYGETDLMQMVMERWGRRAGRRQGLDQTFLYNMMICISKIVPFVQKRMVEQMHEWQEGYSDKAVREGKELVNQDWLAILIRIACEDHERFIQARNEWRDKLKKDAVKDTLAVGAARSEMILQGELYEMCTPPLLCALYDALEDTVEELYHRYPPSGWCVAPEEYPYEIDCDPRHEDRPFEKYLAEFQQGARYWIDLLLDYILECVQHAFNPPCPTGSTCESVVLACAEVRCHKGKFVLERVTTSCCRRYAGSFNSEYYWRSITPTACEMGGLMAGGLERFHFGRLYDAQDTQQALRAFTGLRSLAIGRVDALKEMARPMEMMQPTPEAQHSQPAVGAQPAPAAEPVAATPAFETQIKAMQGRMDKMEAQLAEAQKLNVSLMETVKQLQSQPKLQPEPEPQSEPQAQPKKASPARKKTQEGKS